MASLQTFCMLHCLLPFMDNAVQPIVLEITITLSAIIGTTIVVFVTITWTNLPSVH